MPEMNDTEYLCGYYSDSTEVEVFYNHRVDGILVKIREMGESLSEKDERALIGCTMRDIDVLREQV